jgi:hypothetical protein
MTSRNSCCVEDKDVKPQAVPQRSARPAYIIIFFDFGHATPRLSIDN